LIANASDAAPAHAAKWSAFDHFSAVADGIADQDEMSHGFDENIIPGYSITTSLSREFQH
jgi:hypothetical protein